MPKKLTKKEFIAKAVTIHGMAYDYSKVDYINAMTPVLMACSIHGNPDDGEAEWYMRHKGYSQNV